MEKQIRLVLGAMEVGQILDGLQIRAEAWRKTAAYLRDGDSGDDFFLIEECSKPEEAEAIAQDYEKIIAKIEAQQDAQPPSLPTPQIQPPPQSGSIKVYAIYINFFISGREPIERDENDMPVAYASEHDAHLEIADGTMERLRQFLAGERDFDDAITVEEFVQEVDLHPDGSISDEYGNRYPNDRW